MDPVSRLLHTATPIDGSRPTSTPIFQTAAFEASSPYFYTRKDNPNVSELEIAVAQLENAKHAVAFGCGMAAIYATLDLVRPGETVVLNKLVYGCTFKLLQRLSERRGFSLRILDLTADAGVDGIPEGVRLVIFETPTNPFLRTINIANVATVAKRRHTEAIVVVDNTWATPLFQHPLEFGADISLHSGTKYLSGHSDVMSGVAVMNRDDLADDLRQTRFYGGLVLAPHDAWLTRRSLQTLDLRLRHQQTVTQHMREFLEQRPEVREVYYPTIDGRQLTGYGGILFFAFTEAFAGRYIDFRDSLKLFATGTGMACTISMVAQPYTGSHASMNDEEKSALGLDRNLVRLCFGLEAPADLLADLTRALDLLASPLPAIDPTLPPGAMRAT